MPRTVTLAVDLPRPPAPGRRSKPSAARSPGFGNRDIASTLILSFSSLAKGGRIELNHVNVADRDFGGVSEGWSRYYFVPWRAYLDRK